MKEWCLLNKLSLQLTDPSNCKTILLDPNDWLIQIIL